MTVVGRPATEEDVKTGDAIFYVATGSSAYDVGHPLPARARLTDDIECDDGTKLSKGTEILVIQAEMTTDDRGDFVTIGFLNGSEQGVCAFEEIEVLERT